MSIQVSERNGKPYYRAQIVIGYGDNGKPIRKSISGYDKKEVQMKLNEFKYKFQIGEITTTTTITLEKYFYNWLWNYKRAELKTSSFTRYESIYRNYIKDTTLGKMKIQDIRRIHCQKHITGIINTNTLSVAKTARKVIITCLNDAYNEGIIGKNWMSTVKMPKNKEKINKYMFFTDEEQRLILKSLTNERYDLGIKIAFGTGFRLGEILALTWNDLNIEECTLEVNKSLKQTLVVHDDETRSSQLLLQTPKTESSYRTVPIPENLLKSIIAYRKTQLETIMKNRDIYNDQGYILADDLGNPLEPRTLPRYFKTVQESLELPYRKFHSIRHSYATRLFELDIPVKTVQVLLGHKDIATTMNIYTHVVQEKKDNAAESINYLFA